MVDGISGSVLDDVSFEDIYNAWVTEDGVWKELVTSYVTKDGNWTKWYDPIVDVTQVYEYTGALQTFFVPPRTETLFCRVWGCGGANGRTDFVQDDKELGGYGGYSDIQIAVGGGNTVQPEDTLHIVVGGLNGLGNIRKYGGGGREPRGGGGCSAIFTSASGLGGSNWPAYGETDPGTVPNGIPTSGLAATMYNSRIVVSGGGGGAGDNCQSLLVDCCAHPRGGNGGGCNSNVGNGGPGHGSGSSYTHSYNSQQCSGGARGGRNRETGDQPADGYPWPGGGTGTARQWGRAWHGAGDNISNSSSHGGGSGLHGGGGGEHGSGGGAGAVAYSGFVGLTVMTSAIQYYHNEQNTDGHQRGFFEGQPSSDFRSHGGNHSGLVVIKTLDFADSLA